MSRYLSGIQPTGLPHLGNYFGAIQQHVAVSQNAAEGGMDAFFFIADLHSLTTIFDAKDRAELVRGVAATYLALGLAPERATFFRQSDVPEVAELTWLLATCSGMGLLERAHSYKDKVARGISPSVGLFTYPILMAADILIYDSDVVPVGKDQVQHIEMAQDMAGHFNHRYGGEFLKYPKWQLSPTPTVPGTDGAKMSKSYGNTLWLFDEGKALKKSVNSIVTDSRLPAEPKNPDELPVFKILELFLNESENKEWRERIQKGGEDAPGYGHVKKEIMARMDERFGAAREQYRAYMDGEQRDELEDILRDGALRARAVAKEVLARCYVASGFPQRAASLRG